MEDGARLATIWEERLAEIRHGCGDAADAEATRQEHQYQKQQQSLVVILVSGGLELLNLLLQMDEKGMKSPFAGEGEEECKLRRRITELLAEVVVLMVQSCTVDVGEMEDLCQKLNASHCPPERDEKGLRVMLRRWWDSETIAERGWRWCEAHLTLSSSDEASWFRGTPSNMTNWWWCPEVMSATASSSTPKTTANAAWPLFEDFFVVTPSTPSATQNNFGGELKSAAEFLDALHTSESIFVHRIQVKSIVLQRFHIAKATSLLHQAHLLCLLSLVTQFVRLSDGSEGKKPDKAYGIGGQSLVWVLREGFSLGWGCLLTAMSAVQVATVHFNALCDGLRGRIRWALFGVRDAIKVDDRSPEPFCSDSMPFVHPFAEPSDNAWRIVHGTGLIATGRIPEGEVILQESPLLFVDASAFQQQQQQEEQKPSTREAELSTVMGAAMAVFQRSGLSHIDDTVKSRMVENVLGGALFGDAIQDVDMWGALHLFSLMPFVENDLQQKEGGKEFFACCVASMLRCWDERAITVRPAEDFRIGRSDTGGVGKALYPLASLINHSCSPNALRIFTDHCGVVGSLNDKRNLCVISIRDIEPGEEITVAYLPSLLVPRSVKRFQNGFWCRCAFCRLRSAFLEGVICPECRQLIYEEEEEEMEEKSGDRLPQAVHVDPNVEVSDSVKKRTSPYVHAADCTHAGCSSYKEMVKCTTWRFRKALHIVHLEFLENVDGSCRAQNDDTGSENQSIGKEGEGQGRVNHNAGRTLKAMRRLMDLDSFAVGLPSTHHYRLQVRMECLVTSLNANVTPHDGVRLLQLCEELLEDMESLLPPNYPLLTGIRIHYCLHRARHLIAASDGEDLDNDLHFGKCCGAVREQVAMMHLPYVQDATIREYLIRSFQEHHVYVGWQFSPLDSHRLLQSYLERYTVELLMCGIDDVLHLNTLSLINDAVWENKTEL